MRRRLLSLAAILVLTLSLIPVKSFALGTEEFGDEQLSAANYTQWPGLFELASDKTRVYSNWVNGHETFYFAGNTDQLNEALKQFAAIKIEKHEVLIRPGPGKAHSFNRERIIDCNWNVEVYGGISAHVVGKEKGDHFWSTDPTMTIWTGGGIDLAKIKFPEGVTVVGVNEKSARAREGLDSKDQTVRGWGLLLLPDLNPYHEENYKAVEKLLKDEVSWVRLCAAGGIKQFGPLAKPALPLLREAEKSDDAQLKKAAAEAIAAIEAAPENEAAAKEFNAAVEQIAELKAGLEK